MRHLVFLLLLALPLTAFAANNNEALYNGIHQPWISTSAMGMGNSFMLVDDNNILFYNPAALANVKEGEININLITAASSMGDESFMTLYGDIQDASDAPEADKEEEMAKVITDAYGNFYYARIKGPNFSWVRPKWGFALNLLDLTIALSPHRGIGPMVDAFVYQDTTLAYGRGHTLKSVPGLTIGWNAKMIYRMFYDTRLSIDTLIDDGDILDKKDMGEGATLDGDISANYVLPWEYGVKTTVGAAVRNVLDYGFKSNQNFVGEGDAEPPKLQRRFDVGAKFELPEFWTFKPALAAEVRDMGHDNWTFKKGMHLGAKLDMLGWYLLNGSLRAGINQGYMTFGLGLKLLIFELQYSTYGEEIGTTDAKKKSRVHMAQLSFNF